MPETIATKITAIREATPPGVKILAVSKGQPVEAIQEAMAQGLSDFGESYWQEAHLKQQKLQAYPLTWHFIGHVQMNKAAQIAQAFDWVQSLDRLKVAAALDHYRTPHLPPLNICVQVNIDGEPTKSGLSPDDLLPFLHAIIPYKRLKLRGLMIVSKPQTTAFAKAKALFDTVNREYNGSLDILSMGMTDDFVQALEHGATLIRIGRGIFGVRA